MRNIIEFLKNKWWLLFILPGFLLILTIVVLFVGALVLKPHKQYTPQIKGKIIDSETKKPISNARIFVIWEGTNLPFAFLAPDVTLNMKQGIYLSDKKGDFIIPELEL